MLSRLIRKCSRALLPGLGAIGGRGWHRVGLPVWIALICCAGGIFRPTIAPGSGNSFCQTQDLKKVEAHSTGSPRGELFLVVKDESMSPGQVLAARLVNRMNATASYGVGFRIERYADGSWELDPSSPKGPWPKKLGRLDPDSAGQCFYTRIPAEQPQGRYRIIAFVHVARKQSSRSKEWSVRS